MFVVREASSHRKFWANKLPWPQKKNVASCKLPLGNGFIPECSVSADRLCSATVWKTELDWDKLIPGMFQQFCNTDGCVPVFRLCPGKTFIVPALVTNAISWCLQIWSLTGSQLHNSREACFYCSCTFIRASRSSSQGTLKEPPYPPIWMSRTIGCELSGHLLTKSQHKKDLDRETAI